MKNKIIIIIGARGSLGQALCGAFPQALGWDRDEIDITEKEQVNEKITELRPTVVINAAAYNDVDACEDEKQLALAQKINGAAVGYLADVCKNISAVLAHYSTNYVFKGDRLAGYIETDEPSPISNYGLSKLAGEREILSRAGLKFYLIRTSKLFGEKGKSAVAKENFFDVMLNLSKKQNEIKAVDEELSNFTYTPDLARATKSLIAGNYEPGIYHIVNENPATWCDGARVLFDILGKDVKLKAVGADAFRRPAKRPRYGILLNTKLPKLRSYQEALLEYLKNQITNNKN